MNLQTILDSKGAPRPTKAQLKAAQALLFAVAEAVRTAGEIPSGTIYAAVAGSLSLEAYAKLLTLLERAELIVVEPSNLIRWVGPKVAA
jgi:hypothetical protein